MVMVFECYFLSRLTSKNNCDKLLAIWLEKETEEELSYENSILLYFLNIKFMMKRIHRNLIHKISNLPYEYRVLLA